MDAFSFQNTTSIHFGAGSIAKTLEELPEAAKVLLLYGGGSIKANGVYQQVRKFLERGVKEKKLTWGEFSGIEPNPRYETLMKAVELIEQQDYNFLLAVGGGSVVDGTKFIAAAVPFRRAAPSKDPWNILEKESEIREALPLGCILTLPATGTESNGNAVVTRGKQKLAFGSNLVLPRFAILDPTTTLSLSPRQVSNGVVDAYAHVLEQYLTYPVNAKVQDRFAEGILLTLIEEGPKALADPHDLAVRSNIMWAATQALNGLIGAGVPEDWTTHMIGHELTALYGVDHGRSLTIIFPAVMKFSRAAKEEKLCQYGERVFGIVQGSNTERAEKAIQASVDFFRRMQCPVSLADIELGAEQIDDIMSNWIEPANYSQLGEHRNINVPEIRQILHLALEA